MNKKPTYSVPDDPSVLFRGFAEHAPRLVLDPPQIIGCTCGWETPAGTTDSDDAFAMHFARELVTSRKEIPVTKKQGGVFNGVKVFSATMIPQRNTLGETITAWLEEARTQRPGFQIVDKLVRQSSDEAYHCVTVILFFHEDLTGPKGGRRG